MNKSLIEKQNGNFANTVLAEVPLVVSFLGGRTSAFMARALQLRYEGKRDLIFIFANTGKERIETLDFINECQTRWNFNCIWLEYDLVENKSTFKIVDYNSASRNGEPFEKMIAKYGIPNKAFPHCTRELKRQTITRYLRTIGLILFFQQLLQISTLYHQSPVHLQELYCLSDPNLHNFFFISKFFFIEKRE